MRSSSISWVSPPAEIRRPSSAGTGSTSDTAQVPLATTAITGGAGSSSLALDTSSTVRFTPHRTLSLDLLVLWVVERAPRHGGRVAPPGDLDVPPASVDGGLGGQAIHDLAGLEHRQADRAAQRVTVRRGADIAAWRSVRSHD